MPSSADFFHSFHVAQCLEWAIRTLSVVF